MTSVSINPAQHDFNSSHKDAPLHGVDMSQLGKTLPSGWGNPMIDPLNFSPLAQITTTAGWTPLTIPDTIPGLHGFDNQPQKLVSLQDVESSDASLSSFLPLTDTNPSLHHHDSVLGFDAASLPPKPLMRTRSQSKRQTRVTSTCEPPAKEPSPSASALAASDRSERARKAANRRHSRAKESHPSPSEHRRTKTDIDREKNRIAAAKCRGRKRIANDALDAEYRAATAANTRLTQEQRELRDQLACWRMLALQHGSGSRGCRCNAIHRYNTDQAMKAVGDMDAGRLGSFGFSSMNPGVVQKEFLPEEFLPEEFLPEEFLHVRERQGMSAE